VLQVMMRIEDLDIPVSMSPVILRRGMIYSFVIVQLKTVL
jgi:hypothetical protein